MTQVAFIKTIVRATIAASILIPSLTGSAFACESVLCKIGDGPKHVLQDIVTPNKVDPPAPAPAAAQVNHYSATYRVDCVDAQTGADRADSTITAGSYASTADAMNFLLNLSHQQDLCQGNGDTSRITKPGSGRFM